MSKYILKAENISKKFFQGNNEIKVLDKAKIFIEEATLNVITGKSGSGKSTLLHILSGLDTPDEGKIFFEDKNIVDYNEMEKNNFRTNNIGFVFQFHNLLVDFSAYENVLLPLKISGTISKQTIEFANYIINKLEIFDRINHFPNQLSGGEQQRFAIARAIVNNPQILFADEPTGNLDVATSDEVMELFKKINNEFKTTIIIVTHDKEISSSTNKIFYLEKHSIKNIN